MNKYRVMSLVNDEPLKSFLGEILSEKIDQSLDHFGDYEVRFKDNILRIYTDIKDGVEGNYLEIVASKNSETNYRNLLITRKQYSPNYQLINGFNENAGIDMFTEINSYVYNENMRVYSSWYSDDNKYYGSEIKNLPSDKQSITKYIEETSPKYKNGIFISGAKKAYQPFIDIWQRYGNTNVIRKYGRSPINGEYSKIGITFDNDMFDQLLLEENNGFIYSVGYDIKYDNELDIIVKIQEIFNNYRNGNEFDLDGFNYEFYNEMYKKNNRR